MFPYKDPVEGKRSGSYLSQKRREAGTLWRCKVPSVHGECCICFENKNCICGTESYNCSSDRSEKNPSFCAWHEENTALPEPFRCGCGVQLVLVSGSDGAYSRRRFYKYLASLYPKDMGVIDLTGIYCCDDARSYGGTPYRCGELRVGPCCKKKHPGCARVSGSDTDSDTDSDIDSDADFDIDTDPDGHVVAGSIVSVPAAGH